MASQARPEESAHPPTDSPTLPSHSVHLHQDPPPEDASAAKKSASLSPGHSPPAVAVAAAAENPIDPDSLSTSSSSNIEADSWTDDQGYAESTSTSYLTSIASEIRRGIEDNGRIYAAYGIHKPWLPTDDLEVG